MNSFDLKDFNTVIYDMDGVLIDSEPLWKIAMEEVFSEVGANLTRKDFEKTVGLRIDEVVNYWYQQRPWDKLSCDEVLNLIIQRMVSLIKSEGKVLPGVLESLTFFKENNFKIGLATSSYEVLIDTVLEVLDIKSYFDFTHSAEHEEYGKPHPQVYIYTAEKLMAEAQKCLVIEDSLNGVIAGKAAKMFVICIPEKTHNPNPKLQLADLSFDNLNELLANISVPC